MEPENNMEVTAAESKPAAEPESAESTVRAAEPASETEAAPAAESAPAAEEAPAEEQHPRRRRRPALETENEEYYPLDRCCICGHPLDTGCAILLTDDHGMARIDENCCRTMEAAARSADKAEVARAFDYLAAWMPYVKQPVADHLRDYLRVVQTYLNS